jgi:tRNA threonylcarbamoyladenosine biosynthesis protein TsaE
MAEHLDIETSSDAETFQLGVALGQVLRPLDVILLTGELGAGKTRLAKGIVSIAAGVDPDEVVSPTFALINRYRGRFPVFHADLYRLEGRGIEDIGLDDALEAGGALIVEWAECIQDFDPDPLMISIEYGKQDHERRFRLTWRQDGSWENRIRTRLKAGEQIVCL